MLCLWPSHCKTLTDELKWREHAAKGLKTRLCNMVLGSHYVHYQATGRCTDCREKIWDPSLSQRYSGTHKRIECLNACHGLRPNGKCATSHWFHWWWTSLGAVRSAPKGTARVCLSLPFLSPAQKLLYWNPHAHIFNVESNEKCRLQRKCCTQLHRKLYTSCNLYQNAS